MALEIGSHLGSYEITGLLGIGGMGEVYRGRDLKLKRQVAIKILPEMFSHDTDRVSRFQREAEVLASLNHPNIASIYEIQEARGLRFLVLELVDGETLADRISRGPIVLGETIRIAQGIGEALEAAHEKGIIHRDLKPANVKLTASGQVKVLDFGLAKTLEDEVGNAHISNSPTMMTGTLHGLILGTAAYMSPEQARGKPVDKRTDIWAFGVVIYEMLTGRSAFKGEDVTATLAKVIESEPSWQDVPLQLQRLLKKCLEKDPKKRLRDVGDSWELLEDVHASSKPQFARQWLWLGVAAVLALAVLVAIWAPVRSGEPSTRPLIRLDVDLGPNVTLSQSNSGSRVIVSPDGTRLAYYSGNPGILFTRRLDQDRATALPGTEGDVPFFSPDSEWIGLIGNLVTKKVSVDGGAVIPVAAIGGPGASWAENGDIFIGLTRIPAGGGEPSQITNQSRPGASFGYVPQALPGGKAILITTRQNFSDEETAKVEVLSLADGTTKPLVQGTTGRYVPSGHLLYSNKGTLFAIPFDLKRMETYGNAVLILSDVAHMSGTGTAQYDVSRDQHGTLVYKRASEAEAELSSTIQFLDTAGKKQPFIAKAGSPHGGRFSPDGNRFLFVDGRNVDLAGGQVFVWDMRREQADPLTPAGRSYRNLQWYPGGKYVLLCASGQGILWTRSDGAREPQPLNAEDKRNLNALSITSDGKWLAYAFGNQRGSQIEIVPLTEENGQLKSGKPEVMPGGQPSFSPDSKWIAYTGASSVAGRRAGEQGAGTPVYVSAFHPGAASEVPRIAIAPDGGQPKWLPDGRTLIFRSGDQLMAVDYSVKDGEFIAAKPRVWIKKLGGTEWDLDPRNSNRVAVTIPAEPSAAAKPEHEVVLLLNFFDYLRQKVPVK